MFVSAPIRSKESFEDNRTRRKWVNGVEHNGYCSIMGGAEVLEGGPGIGCTTYENMETMCSGVGVSRCDD